jgi:agmatine deiminase
MKPAPGNRSCAEYLMPAEWEPHAATWLAWPHYRPDWPGKFAPIPWVFAEIIRYLARRERVEIIVQDGNQEKHARQTLERAHALSSQVRFHRWPTNRVWTRDSGCVFVFPPAADTSGSSEPAETKATEEGRRAQAQRERREPARPLVAIKWMFNAWAKYPNWRRDNELGSRMAAATGAREVRPQFGSHPVVLEGGAIDVNGRGSLIATEECLLSQVQQRNPAMKKHDYDAILARYLGTDNVIWLSSGIKGDDTHGHVDDVTRFVSPDTVVTSVDADPASDNYQALRENIRRLRDATTEEGNPLSVIDLPLPAPLYFEGRRLPASYANFYVANGLVLVPVFNDPNDRVALDLLADVYPEREIVGIYSGDLIWGFGAIHCMTQQQPAGRSSPRATKPEALSSPGSAIG